MNNWTRISVLPPPENTIVKTKVEDGDGTRNESYLIRRGSLYWLTDGSMYVYYKPTHWKEA